MTTPSGVTVYLCVVAFVLAIPPGSAGWGNPYYGDSYGGWGGYGGGGLGYGGFPGWGGGGYSSSNALGGGQIGYGSIDTDNTAFSQGGMGFAHGNTNARGFGANIFSAATSNSMGNGFFGRRR